MVKIGDTTVVTEWLVKLLLVVTWFVVVEVTGEITMDGELDNSESLSKGVILNALTFGSANVNVSIDGCEWKKDLTGEPCRDSAIKFYLYTSHGSPRREIDPRNSATSLASAGWVQQHHTVVLIHGYGGGDNTIPISILRDGRTDVRQDYIRFKIVYRLDKTIGVAISLKNTNKFLHPATYLRHGDFNVIMVDWSALSPVPCYPAAVHNSAHVGRCAAAIPRMLRDAGAAADGWTCVGHSLGAHVCGTMSDYLSFRVHKIIGLDPARPLVRPTARYRLDPSDAAVVHVLHTDAGHYGETGRLGSVDFCVNGGRTQPYCRLSVKGEHLCNHISAICYLAESLDPEAALVAEPCSRRCRAVRLRPGIDRETARVGGPILMGQYSPDSASGTYCASVPHQPYCPKKPGDRGHPKCCIGRPTKLIDDNKVTPTRGPKPEPEPTDAPGFIDDPDAPSTSSTPSSTPEPRDTLSASAPFFAQPTFSTTLLVNLTRNLREENFTTSAPFVTQSEPPVNSRMNAKNDVVFVLPTTGIASSTPATTTTEEEPVFPVYSTVTETSTGPVLVVMGTPLKNTSDSSTESPVTSTTSPPPFDFSPFIPTNPRPPRPFSFRPFSINQQFPSLSSHPMPPPMSQPMSPPMSPAMSPPLAIPMSPPLNPDMFMVDAPMTDMLPPKPTHDLPPPPPPAPASSPLPPTPQSANTLIQESATPIPGAPESEDDLIPMVGSLTGPWVPMVMLPPTPFSTDSWRVRASAKVAPVRRSIFRNYIYD